MLKMKYVKCWKWYVYRERERGEREGEERGKREERALERGVGRRGIQNVKDKESVGFCLRFTAGANILLINIVVLGLLMQ